MKTSSLFLIAFLACALQLLGEETVKIETITLKGGRTFTGVTVTKKSDIEARVIHSSGVATVPLADLPADVAAKLGYPRAEAEAAAAARLKDEQAREAAIRDALDFKGLRLGMLLNQIPRLIEETLWTFNKMDVLMERINLKDPNARLSLDSDSIEERKKKGFSDTQAAEFSSVGRDGVGDNAFWYYISDVRVNFVDGKLAEIKVYGPSWSADRLKTSTLRWLELADNGLQKKYGKPTEIIIPLKSFNILNAESGYMVFVSKWSIRNQTIYLGVLESDSKFAPMIIYYDDDLKERLESLGEGKSNL
jgi:hypothetical protein